MEMQECIIVKHTADIRHYATKEDTIVYVYGAKNNPNLQATSGFRMEKDFNEWMNVYIFSFQ